MFCKSERRPVEETCRVQVSRFWEPSFHCALSGIRRNTSRPGGSRGYGRAYPYGLAFDEIPGATPRGSGAALGHRNTNPKTMRRPGEELLLVKEKQIECTLQTSQTLFDTLDTLTQNSCGIRVGHSLLRKTPVEAPLVRPFWRQTTD